MLGDRGAKTKLHRAEKQIAGYIRPSDGAADGKPCRPRNRARTPFTASAIIAWFVLSLCIACSLSDPARIPMPPPVPLAPQVTGPLPRSDGTADLRMPDAVATYSDAKTAAIDATDPQVSCSRRVPSRGRSRMRTTPKVT